MASVPSPPSERSDPSQLETLERAMYEAEKLTMRDVQEFGRGSPAKHAVGSSATITTKSNPSVSSTSSPGLSSARKPVRGVPSALERRASEKTEVLEKTMPSYDDIGESRSRFSSPHSPQSKPTSPSVRSTYSGTRALESLSVRVADAQAASLRRRLDEMERMREIAMEELAAAQSDIERYKADLEHERERADDLRADNARLQSQMGPPRKDACIETEEILLLGEHLRSGKKQDQSADELKFADSFIQHARDSPKVVLDEFPGLLSGAMGGSYGKAVGFLLSERLRLQIHYELLDLLKASLESQPGSSQQLAQDLYVALHATPMEAGVSLPSDAIWSEVLRWQDSLLDAKAKEIEALRKRATLSASSLLNGKSQTPQKGRLRPNEELKGESPERQVHTGVEPLAMNGSGVLEKRVRDVRLSEEVRRQRSTIIDFEQRISSLKSDKESLEQRNAELQKEVRNMSAQLAVHIRTQPSSMIVSSNSGSLSARESTRNSSFSIRKSIRTKARERSLSESRCDELKESTRHGERFDDYSIHRKCGHTLGDLSLLTTERRRTKMEELKRRQKWERLQSLHIKEGTRWPNFAKFFENGQQPYVSET